MILKQFKDRMFCRLFLNLGVFRKHLQAINDGQVLGNESFRYRVTVLGMFVVVPYLLSQKVFTEESGRQANVIFCETKIKSEVYKLI